MNMTVSELVNVEVGTLVTLDVSISSYEKRETTTGKTFASLSFADNETSITGVHWGLTDIAAEFYATHDYARITADYGEFNGKSQLTVKRISEIPSEELDITKLKKVAPIPADYMVADIENTIDNLRDDAVRLVTLKRWEAVKPKFVSWVAAKAMHHNYETGLLYHTYSMLQIAKSMVAQYPAGKLDSDIVYAAIILHDTEKVSEYEMDGTKITISEIGKLFGHIFLGAHAVLKAASDLKNTEEYKTIDYSKVKYLVHAILAHHGKLEHGSPVEPKTIEAQIVHQIDILDSRMGMTYDK